MQPIVLVHGFLGDTHDWDYFSLLTQSGFELHKISLPQHGNTSTLKSYSLKDFAHFIQNYCELKGLKKSIFFGYSMGGRILLELFRQREDLFKGLILESTNPGISDPKKRTQRVQTDQAWAQLLKNDPDFLKKWYSQELFDSFRSHPTFHNHLQRRIQNFQPDLYKILIESSPGTNPSYFDLIEGLSIPTLCLVGEWDSKYKELWQKRFEKNKNLDIRAAPNSGHVVHLENPEWTLKAVQEFVLKLKS